MRSVRMTDDEWDELKDREGNLFDQIEWREQVLQRLNQRMASGRPHLSPLIGTLERHNALARAEYDALGRVLAANSPNDPDFPYVRSRSWQAEEE